MCRVKSNFTHLASRYQQVLLRVLPHAAAVGLDVLQECSSTASRIRLHVAVWSSRQWDAAQAVTAAGHGGHQPAHQLIKRGHHSC